MGCWGGGGEGRAGDSGFGTLSLLVVHSTPLFSEAAGFRAQVSWFEVWGCFLLRVRGVTALNPKP